MLLIRVYGPVLDINNGFTLQWGSGYGQTPITWTLPIAASVLCAMGITADSNDGYVDTIAIFNYEYGSIQYIVGNWRGEICNEGVKLLFYSYIPS